MRDIARKVKEGLDAIARPVPSFFDFCVAVFLIIPFITNNTAQMIMFVFYIIFLICLSMGLTPQRNYKSTPLMLLALWSLIGVFVHSFAVSKESITYKYLNVYLMSEGFIYIFFGILFLITVIKYSTNLKFLYFLLPIALIPTFKMEIFITGLTYIPRWNLKDFTFWGSIATAVFIYFLLRRKYIIVFFISLWGLFMIGFLNKLIMTRFVCRPLVWQQLVKEIFQHPLFGTGFSKGIFPPDNLLLVEKYGYVFRHNDYLSLGAYLGISAMIIAVWFVVETIKKVGIRPELILILSIAIMCFFQLTMFKFSNAAIYLTIGALVIQENIKKQEGET
jgi:hypothetical protein